MSWLTSRLIGQVLGRVAMSPPLDELRSDSGIWTTLTEDLASILHENINERGFIGNELYGVTRQISEARKRSVPDSELSPEALALRSQPQFDEKKPR